ncbi:MAG TPA: site-specific integrase [Candidatus Dormibacteraeota bacterium]|nr:site-specific integrase [Candidatus Dormibacteraeota bacterium]
MKRSPGSWTIVLDGTPDPVTGQRRQVSRSVRGPKREAERVLVELLNQRDRGAGIHPERLTVGDFLRDWAAGLDLRVRPSTAVRYRQIVVTHLLPQLGAVRLSRLSATQVNTLLADRLTAGCAPRTVAHIRAVLRTALNDAVRADLLGRNVATLATPPHVPSRPVAPMGPAEAMAILTATAPTRLGPIVATALYTGLRQGEVLGLQWADLDLDGGQCRVTVALQRINGQLQLVEPKSATSRRTVPLAPPLVPILRAHRTAQIEAQLRAGPAWTELLSGLVFTTALGRPLQGTVITREFHAACAAAGLPPRPFHHLRHGCATLLLASGVDLKTVSAVLGHSTISLTANTYAAVLPSLAAGAMTRLGALLTAAGSPAP